VKLALVLALALVPATAAAWEPQTTHAGLAEQAALVSRLHKRLVALGFVGGLFEPLTIPPADAPALSTALKLLSPTHGSVPDARGRQSALAWLTAGAALADLPASQGANHFFDPATGQGWTPPGRGLGGTLGKLVGGGSLPDKGMPAPDWLIAKTNPFNVEQFLNQYARRSAQRRPASGRATWPRRWSRPARCCTRSAISARRRGCAVTRRLTSIRSAPARMTSARGSNGSRR